MSPPHPQWRTLPVLDLFRRKRLRSDTFRTALINSGKYCISLQFSGDTYIKTSSPFSFTISLYFIQEQKFTYKRVNSWKFWGYNSSEVEDFNLPGCDVMSLIIVTKPCEWTCAFLHPQASRGLRSITLKMSETNYPMCSCRGQICWIFDLLLCLSLLVFTLMLILRPLLCLFAFEFLVAHASLFGN